MSRPAPTVTTELVELLRLLCSRAGMPDLSALGAAEPSPRSPDAVRVDRPGITWLSSLDARGWSIGESGAAELNLAAPCRLADLASLGAPLPVPRSPGDTGPVVRLEYDDPDLPARAVLYCTLTGEPGDPLVAHITVRLDSRCRPD